MPVPHSPHSSHLPHKPREPHEACEPQSSILSRATCDACCGPCRAGLHEGPEAAPLGSYRQLSNLGRAQETQKEEEQRKQEQRQQRQGK